MTPTRRQAIDACRGGAALFADVPGNEIDLERLGEFVVARGLDVGIHVIDGTLEGMLWVRSGVPGEAWFLEADGGETIVPIEPERELLRDIAASGTVSCYVCAPDRAPTEAPLATAAPTKAPPAPTSVAVRAPRPPAPSASSGPALDVAAGPPNVAATSAASAVVDEAPAAVAAMPAIESVPEAAFPFEPPTLEPEEASQARPWPAILIEVRARVNKQRGKRLAERFGEALNAALGAHGGRYDGDRIVAPPLSDVEWAAVVAAACAPVTAVAGRAWTDRTLDSAERTVLEREGWR